MWSQLLLHIVAPLWLAVLPHDSHCAIAPNDVKRLLARGSRSRLGRSLLYPEPGTSETKVQVLFGLGLPMEEELSMTLGYVIKCNYNLPYNASSQLQPTHRSISQEERLLSRGSRWSLYRILEAAMDKSCLLRAVCEAAELPLFSGRRRRQGLAAQLLQLMLTPSATREDYELYADRQYRAAEAKGRSRDCSHFYRDCPHSPLDYFTALF